jgi:hypothetical protein
MCSTRDVINSVRFGFNQIAFTAKSAFEIDPSTLGINIGVNRPIGLPQLNVAGGFNFGGPSRLPQERTDTTFVFAYTIDYQRGPHSIKAGAEYRTFFNDNYNSDTGSVNFPSVAAFLLGNANSFSITLGTLSDKIKQTAVGFFVRIIIASSATLRSSLVCGMTSTLHRPNKTIDLSSSIRAPFLCCVLAVTSTAHTGRRSRTSNRD